MWQLIIQRIPVRTNMKENINLRKHNLKGHPGFGFHLLHLLHYLHFLCQNFLLSSLCVKIIASFNM